MENLPSKEITVKVQSNEYVIKFPNVGQLMDIEIKKSAFSSGQYGGLSTGSDISYYAKTLIDMIATFEVLAPELVKGLTVKNIAELDLLQSTELYNIYNNEYFPWFSEWIKVISTAANKE